MPKNHKPPGDICRNCFLDVPSDMTIRLWDGKTYCENCVEGAHPGLAEYARAHETLEEEMPHSSWRIWVTFMIIGVVGMFGFSIFLWVMCIWHGADPVVPGGPFMFLVFQVLALPISTMLATARAIGFATYRPTVSVRNGQLEITTCSTTRSFSLSACEWYIGKTCHMTYPNNTTALLPGRAVVFILPNSVSRWECSRRLAAGFTEETRQRLEVFLTLAAVPRRLYGLPRNRR